MTPTPEQPTVTEQSTNQWFRTSDRRPLKGQRIEWISSGGERERGVFLGGAVWMPEGSDMYVYYTPERWRPL